MATVGLYGSSSSGVVAAATGSESTGLYGNGTTFGGSYFEWFIFKVADTQPATPTGGSWSFSTNSGTPPTGWTVDPPVNPTNTVWVSIALVNSKNASNLTWSEPGKFSFASGLPILSGNGAPEPTDGQSDQLYVQLDTSPQTIWFKESGTWTRLTGSTLYVTASGNQTITGTKTFSSTIQGSVSGTAGNVTGIVAIANGGTGATTASGARAALSAAQLGANADITSMTGLTGGISTPDYIDFDTTATPARATGRLWWDNSDGIQTLNLGMAGSNATMQIGEETYYRIKATSAITEGQVVMFTGTVGASGALQGAPAYALTADTASYLMGIATENISVNGWGYITAFGLVRGIDTTGGVEAWADGDILYYNPLVAGGLTNVVPAAPNAKIQVCAVVHAANNGSLFVRPTYGGKLGQFEGDVQISSPVANNSLFYTGTRWENYAPSAARTALGLGTSAVLNAGTANGVATLDAGGTVPLSQLPASIQGGVSYQGSWNASTNTPTLTSSVGTKGYYYVVSVAGGTNLNGITDWLPGDWAIFNGTAWEKIDNTDSVSSVNGYTGAVSLTYSDVNAPSTTGTNASGTWAINISGNAATATTSTNVSGGSASVTSFTNSGSTTLTSGTANGVAYLNGSKVLTTGSALTFDGTNLGVGAGSALTNITINGNASGGFIRGQRAGANQWFVGDTASALGNGTGLINFVYNNDPFIWYNGGTSAEQMRLTSTGLGIGTSSPGAKLEVAGGGIAIANSQQLLWRTSGGALAQILKLNSSNNVEFGDSQTSSQAMVLASGNLGLGVTPSAWYSSVKVLQVGTGSMYSTTTTQNTLFSANEYLDSSANPKYIVSDYATRYQQYSGQHRWYTAPSGTAGNAISFTQAMTLDANGGLTVVKDGSFQGVTVGRGAGAVSTNTAVGASALAANTTGYQNVAVGSGALAANTTEINNTAVGYRAMYANTTGGANAALGSSALSSNTTGNYNIAVGVNALTANTTASANNAFGYAALAANTTGTQNSAFGHAALVSNTTGGSNTAVGHTALYSNTTASNNTAVGYQAGFSNTTGQIQAFGNAALFSNTTGTNTAVGDSALYSNTTGQANTAVGYAAALLSTGSYNTALGHQALRLSTTASSNTAVGYQAGYSNTTGVGNFLGGYQAGFSNQTGGSLVAIGYQAAYSTTGDRTVAIGYETLKNNTTGYDNVAIAGYRALFSNTTGASNVAIGREALQANTTANYNTAVGYKAGYSNSTGSGIFAFGANTLYNNTTGNNNVSMGGLYANTTGSSNTAIGVNALDSNTTASKNTAIGYQAAYSNTTGEYNIAIGADMGGGSSALYSNTTGGFNVAVGNGALQANTTASANSAFGYRAARANTTGAGIVALGAYALDANTTGSYNTAIGSNALIANTTASNNTAVGYQAGYSNTTGATNAFIGYQAGYGITTGFDNVAVGAVAMGSAGTTVERSTAIGYGALRNTTGSFNTAVGDGVLYNNSTGINNVGVGGGNGAAVYPTMSQNTTGGYNVAVGNQALALNTTGGYNTGLGHGALNSNQTANYNTAVGYYSSKSNTTGERNASLGYEALFSNTTGAFNTAVGMWALVNNTTANHNTAVGYQAGYSNQTGPAVTYLGKVAGYSTTGGYNTFVGDSAGYYITSGANNTILGRYNGNQGGLDIRTANNWVVLSDGDGVPVMWSNRGANWNTTYQGRDYSNYAGAIPTITAGTGCTIQDVQITGGTGAYPNAYMRIYFTLYQGTGSNKSVRFSFSRIGLGVVIPFWFYWTGEYPTDVIKTYAARVATDGSGGNIYSSQNYEYGGNTPGTFATSGGTGAITWTSGSTSDLATSGTGWGYLEIALGAGIGATDITITYA